MFLMGQLLKIFSIPFFAGALLIGFQNCGQPSQNSQGRDIFIHFDGLQNHEYDIVFSNCSTEICLYTLYATDETNYPIGISGKPQGGDLPLNEDPSPEEPIFQGIYCDVLQQSGFGDVYVSCPQEVQNDSGFYIKL